MFSVNTYGAILFSDEGGLVSPRPKMIVNTKILSGPATNMAHDEFCRECKCAFVLDSFRASFKYLLNIGLMNFSAVFQSWVSVCDCTVRVCNFLDVYGIIR